MSSVLLLTRDRAVRQLVRQSLGCPGNEVICAESAEEAIRDVFSVKVDLAVLDEAALDGVDMASLAEWLRGKLEDLPLLFLAAVRSNAESLPVERERDRVLSRPFTGEALRAAAGQAIGPAAVSNGMQPAANGFILDREALRLRSNGGSLSLTPVQFRLVEALASRRGAIVPAAQLLRDVWGESNADASADLLRSHLHLLRRKLRQAFRRDPIETVPHHGYRLN